MAFNDGNRSIDWAKIVTCDAAEEVRPYELAARCADRLSWPVERTAHDELAELACTSALARWLTRWQPIHIHRALLAGASVEAVADALGTSPGEGCRIWHEWAIRQRESIICGRRGVSTGEYATVAQIFTAAGRAPGHRGPPVTGAKLIKWSAVAVVVAVEAIAAVVSYNHALALVEAHGEIGAVARLVPLTVDELIYASSMALLASARQRRRAPRLAYALLALGIGATLSANVAHGLANGSAGAAVAAWPALSLAGSYELLMMIIRAAGQGGPPRADGEPPTLTGHAAAFAAYRASVATGQPMNARQLAARHDISRRQAGQIVSAVAHEANSADLTRERIDSATGY